MLTAAQFEALAQLMQLRASPSREALRLVLCEGKTALEASAVTGVQRPNIYRQQASARKVLELARIATTCD